MIEKLFPIDLPPGFLNNGTTYRAKGRWLKGNLVRFFQGNKQPIGGWVQRSLSGTAILGIPNCAHSWSANDGSNYLAIGTTTNLYVVTGANNQVFDITPAFFLLAPFDWQLGNFGSYLIASLKREAPTGVGPNLFTWQGNTGTKAQSIDTGPGWVYGFVVTPERFLVALRGSAPTLGGGTAPPIDTPL